MIRKVFPIILIVALIGTGFIVGCEKKPKEISLGAVLALSGDAAKYGESCKRGIDLAVKEMNAAGGINGTTIRVIYEDSEADPKKSISAIQKLRTIDKVPAIIGPMGSSEVLAAAPIVEENKIVLLTPTGSAPAITKAGDYVFRNVASDVFEGSMMAKFSYNELQLRRIAILYINNDFGVGLQESFKNSFEEIGGEISSVEVFEQGATDFRTQLSKLKKTNPEAIYIVGYREMGRLLRQAGEMGIRCAFLSFSMFEDPEILEIAGNTAEGVYFTSQTFDPQSKEEIIKKFVMNYALNYGVDPDIFAGLSYDATRILEFAMEKGGFTAAGIKEELYNIRDFPGVTGDISFDKNGDVQKSIAIKMVKGGKFIWYKKLK